MAVTDAERLRSLLGEAIPAGGTADDTLFTDEQVDDLLSRHGGVEDSLGEGWAIKAATLATLVTTTEGSSTRRLSDAHKHAIEQAKLYGWTVSGTNAGRARIGNITRKTGVRRSTAG